MELLSQLYKIVSKSGQEQHIKSFVMEYLKDVALHVTTDNIGNMYITKGISQSYPCVAAHLDEIHTPCQREVIIEGDTLYTVDSNNNRVGCGADDKNGVWTLLQLLHTEPIIKAVFFVQEEKQGDMPGCQGAKVCDLTFFKDVRYIIECDRKGAHDVVRCGKGTMLCDEDFIPKNLLQKYDYQMVDGGKTDVVELKMRGVEIPVCNISCGYYNAHTTDEYTHFSELQKCLSFVKEIVQKV